MPQLKPTKKELATDYWKSLSYDPDKMPFALKYDHNDQKKKKHLDEILPTGAAPSNSNSSAFGIQQLDESMLKKIGEYAANMMKPKIDEIQKKLDSIMEHLSDRAQSHEQHATDLQFNNTMASPGYNAGHDYSGLGGYQEEAAIDAENAARTAAEKDAEADALIEEHVAATIAAEHAAEDEAALRTAAKASYTEADEAALKTAEKESKNATMEATILESEEAATKSPEESTTKAAQQNHGSNKDAEKQAELKKYKRSKRAYRDAENDAEEDDTNKMKTTSAPMEVEETAGTTDPEKVQHMHSDA